jgi:poly-beta-1,6-N-acetyl-D-glucosamine synthase
MMDYVLITPAKNEAERIGRTIRSVASQRHLPLRWIIYDDGSTDDTAGVVSRHLADSPFIELHHRDPDAPVRSFASKVQAVKAAYLLLADSEFEVVCVLDADMELAPEYFEELLREFDADPSLGVASGAILDLNPDGTTSPHPTPEENYAPGSVQVFRRACFEEVGGYLALEFGGVDTVINLMARMSGWSVRTIPTVIARNHRISGSGPKELLPLRLRQGRRDHDIGYHPVYAIGKGLRYCAAAPIPIGGLLYLRGYLGRALRGTRPGVPGDVVRFLREDQEKIMWSLLRSVSRRLRPRPT